jgi:1-deoxy-D-xylulose-5-phosphate synthase
MESRNRLLSSIQEPVDLKNLPPDLFPTLAEEIRREIIRVVSQNGGHLASNLGIVELTLALHAEFESPKDVIIWDVGHQCYPHKLITGRYPTFHTLRKKGGVSGFPKRSESVHDVVETGHASTSISAALGIRVGYGLQNRPGKVIAIIGDGALSGGMALEGMNHAGHLGKDLIIVLNDNKMSISENVGALSSYLSRVTATRLYQDIRDRIDETVKRVPVYGSQLMDLIQRAKKGVKALVLQESLFADLGFEYIGPLDGHDIPLMREVFQKIKGIQRPVVVHVYTTKGKGYIHAENNPSIFHGVSPFSVEDGKIETVPTVSFTERFSKAIVRHAQEDKRIVAITAAMAKGTGLSLFQERFPNRFFDVGITEQHAVTFAAGLATSGMRPVVAMYSTFIQRAVDQVIHDVALPGLPVVFILDRAGLVGEDGETHQGLYDIALFRSIPNLTFLAPASGEELDLMLSFAFQQTGPVLIRYPKADCGKEYPVLTTPLTPGKGVFVQKQGASVLLLSVGGLLNEVEKASNLLSQEGIQTDIYNLRFLKPLDEAFLHEVLEPYRVVVLAEDAAYSGGMGERIGSLLMEWGCSSTYAHLGAPDRFLPHASREELLSDCGLNGKGIASAVTSLLERKSARFLHIYRPEKRNSAVR